MKSNAKRKTFINNMITYGMVVPCENKMVHELQ